MHKKNEKKQGIGEEGRESREEESRRESRREDATQTINTRNSIQLRDSLSETVFFYYYNKSKTRK